MSGICGIVRFDGQKVKKEEIQNMLNVMKNCGNDAEGLWVDGSVAFGHKMLWTTPESLHETQPMIDKESSLVLTADARIDNRDELIEKLEIDKDDYKVITDAQLVLWAYQKWNEECTKYLIGDYAFVIWNIDTQQLFCVRDPMGIRQFYYYKTDDYFVFSSTIASILTDQNIKKRPNVIALKYFMKTIALPYEDTFYEDISRLTPAHTLSVLKKKIVLQRYWFPERIKVNNNLSKKDAVEKFNELFDLAVDARLRSAYPVGSHLSGGLDSSSVVAAACTMHGKDVLTAFREQYGDLDCDESQYSDAFIEQYGLRTESIRGDLLDYENIYTIDWYNELNPDWPGAGLFMPSMDLLKKAKDSGVRVMLTGQGGDHLFTGNDMMLADYLKQGKFIRLYRELKYYGFSKYVIRHYTVLPLLPEKIKEILYAVFHKKYSRKKDIDWKHQGNSFLNKEKKKDNPLAQYDDLQFIVGIGTAFWLSSAFPVSGHYNIEYRHPFFDQRLIEFSLTLPPYMKKEKGSIKRILRDAMGGKLPALIRNRKDKAEFSELLKIQFVAMKIDKSVRDMIIDYDIEKPDQFDADLKAFQKGIYKKTMLFWNMLLTAVWLKNRF